MLNKSFFWPAVLVALAVALAAGLLFFLVAPDVPAPPAAAQDAAPREARELPGGGFAAVDSIRPGGTATGLSRGLAAVDEEPEEPEQPWEKAINQLLDSDDENDKVAAELAALAPTMPLEGQVEAVQHMVNLLEDEHYALARNMLINPSLHPDLREVIFSDVIDRPNSVKLPVLVGLLGIYGHPLRAEAHSNLQVLLGSDLGDDPAVWSAPVQAFLAKEAVEEAEEMAAEEAMAAESKETEE